MSVTFGDLQGSNYQIVGRLDKGIIGALTSTTFGGKAEREDMRNVDTSKWSQHKIENYEAKDVITLDVSTVQGVLDLLVANGYGTNPFPPSILGAMNRPNRGQQVRGTIDRLLAIGRSLRADNLTMHTPYIGQQVLVSYRVDQEEAPGEEEVLQREQEATEIQEHYVISGVDVNGAARILRIDQGYRGQEYTMTRDKGRWSIANYLRLMAIVYPSHRGLTVDQSIPHPTPTTVAPGLYARRGSLLCKLMLTENICQHRTEQTDARQELFT